MLAAGVFAGCFFPSLQSGEAKRTINAASSDGLDVWQICSESPHLL
jgi:hypothetical protein